MNLDYTDPCFGITHYADMRFGIQLRTFILLCAVLSIFLLLLSYNGRSFIRDIIPPASFITTNYEEAERSFRDLEKATQFTPRELLLSNRELSGKLQKAYFTIDEMKNFLLHEMNKIRSFVADRQNVVSRLNRVDRFLMQYTSALELQMNSIDTHCQLREKRIKTWARLSSSVQSRIAKLQNSKVCTRSKVILCTLDNNSGLASGIHDIMWCLVQAYYTGKKLILDSSKWHYNPGGNWNYTFQSLGEDSCTEKQRSYLRRLSATAFNDDQHRGILSNLPFDIGQEMLTLGQNPLPWWYGQLVGYIIRPSKELNELIEVTKKRMGFSYPVVGLHIRRTDKIGSEGDYHAIKEYMWHVERFYEKLKLEGHNVEKRKVFIATDEPNVFKECKDSFPKYEFLYNEEYSLLAKNLQTRYGNNSLWGILVDIYLLASTDYIVCTFSSGLCRVAFEIMQYLKPDALSKAQSLDVPHHYAWALPPIRQALFQHKGSMEIAIGDGLQLSNPYDFEVSAVAGKRKDGFYKGLNLRTKQTGNVPYFKTFPVFQFVKYNNYYGRYYRYNRTAEP